MKKIMLIMVMILGATIITPNVQEMTFAQDNDKNVYIEDTNKEMTKEEAQILLKTDFESEFEYLYQGDENDFEAMKAEGIKGYVFLPEDVPTDLGLLVDKDTHEIYYFHPSGYFELIK